MIYKCQHKVDIKTADLTWVPIEQDILDERFLNKNSIESWNKLSSVTLPPLFVGGTMEYNSKKDLNSDHSTKVWF